MMANPLLLARKSQNWDFAAGPSVALKATNANLDVYWQPIRRNQLVKPYLFASTGSIQQGDGSRDVMSEQRVSSSPTDFPAKRLGKNASGSVLRKVAKTNKLISQ